MPAVASETAICQPADQRPTYLERIARDHHETVRS
jgi:hypothetical protein